MRRLLPAATALAGLALYTATLAPTLLWGDDAELQRIVVTGEARAIGGSSRASHLLWLGLATPFVRASHWLPLDAAGRANLLSALCAALALPFVYAAAVELTAPVVRPARVGGLAAAAAFGLSHTFWLLAVRADVYTLQTALLAAATWAGLRWRASGRYRYLAVTSLAAAAALTNHVMILASALGLGWLVLTVTPRARPRVALGAGVGAAGGLAVLAFAAARGFPLDDLWRAVSSSQLRVPTARDAVLVSAYLAYQFPAALPFAVWGIRRLWQGDKGALVGVGLLYTGNLLLVLLRQHPALSERDHFMFLLPSYFPVALLIGVGVAAAAKRYVCRSAAERPSSAGRGWSWSTPGALRGAVLSALVLVPLLAYPLAPRVVGAAASRLAPARHLPGRDPVAYYLFPGKAGYTGARAYGEAALAAVAPGAAVVADWLPYQTLRYLQQIEGRRPDVRLEMINAGGGSQLRFLLDHAAAQPLYLADNAPFPYYEMADIERCFRVEPESVVYRLTARVGAVEDAACR